VGKARGDTKAKWDGPDGKLEKGRAVRGMSSITGKVKEKMLVLEKYQREQNKRYRQLLQRIEKRKWGEALSKRGKEDPNFWQERGKNSLFGKTVRSSSALSGKKEGREC